MQNKRRKITREVIHDPKTGKLESRFPRKAQYTRTRTGKIVKAVNGKLAGRTKGAFGKCKNPV